VLDNTPNGAGVYSQAADFLAALFRDAPDDQYLEYRIFRKGGKVVQLYTPIAELRENGFGSTLPLESDGKENVYYGVSPRTRHEGTGKAVDTAVAVWFDETTRSAPDLPRFSWFEETSPNKVQGGYFLDRPTNGPKELRRVELLSQRLGQAVGGDTVWDRPRVLRLPSFLNVKPEHPEHPRAFLLEFNPDLRYSLAELERLLPPLAANEQEYTYKEHSGPFDPHSGTPLASGDQERLAAFLQDLGLQRVSDGRYAGACPFPHQDGPSTSESNFYCSPISGFWHCFGSLHVGNKNGGVDPLRLLGFELAPEDDWQRLLVNAFGSDWLGGKEPEPFKKAKKPDVLDVVYKPKPITRSKTFGKKRRVKGGQRWEDAEGLFPFNPRMKPLVRASVLWNEADGRVELADLICTTWRHPTNAQFHRRKIYYHGLPRLRKADVYRYRIPIDDWSPTVHGSLKKRLNRAEADFLWVDNALDRGYYIYLSSVQLPGWELVPDVEAVLVDALKGIAPPEYKKGVEDNSKFRPIGGSRSWCGGFKKPLEEDAGRYELVAQAEREVDKIQVEAELHAEGIRYEETDPKWNRSQFGKGLSFAMPSKEAAIDLTVGWGVGYEPIASSLEVPA